MSSFDFDDLEFSNQPPQVPPQLVIAPVPVPQPPQPPQPPAKGGAGWMIGILSFTSVLFFVLWLMAILPDRFTPGPTPGPDKGTYALIVYDDKGKGDYTDDQRTAIDSAAIADFLTTAVDDWKKIDKDQIGELANLDPAYTPMAEQHMSTLPWVVIRKDGRNVGSEKIENPEQLIELVKRSVK